MYLYKRIIAIGIILFITGCTSDSTEDLIDNTPIGESITYSDDVKSIVDLNCISCHANPPINGAPMSLTTYENVKDAILHRGLIDRISRENGQPGLMPLGGPRLLQSKIDIIMQWEIQGFQP